MNIQQNTFETQEINFKYIFNTCIRNKRLISTIIFISTFSTIIQSLFIKPTFLGTFEIVVKRDNEEVSPAIPESLASYLPGELNNVNKNATQRLILISPFVLNPVYDYVKDERIKRGIYSKETTFNGWKNNNLDVKFTEKTNVLTVNYKDKDKTLIFDTLTLISNRYKIYSKSDREKTLNKTIKYLESQKLMMEKESFNSREKLNKFSIKHGLGDIDGFFVGKTVNPLMENLTMDRPDSLASQINTNLPVRQKQGATSSQRYKQQYNLLENYESTYIDLSSKLSENSKTLKALKNKIDTLKSSLKRPNEILIKYQEYFKEASMDENISDSINQRLEFLRLEKIKTPDPWLMISDPMVFKNKVAPRKATRALIALLISAISATLIAILKEKKQNFIYELEELKKIIGCKYLETIYINQSSLSGKIISNFFDIKESNLNKNFVVANNLFKETSIFKSLVSNKKNINILNFENLDLIDQKSNIILLVESGEYKHSQLITINQYISLNKPNFLGWIFIDKNTKFN